MARKVNLYQFLKSVGLFHSKQEISKVVSSGQITVDGRVTTSMQFQFNPNKKEVACNGKLIKPASKKYFIEVRVLIFPSLPKIFIGFFKLRCGKERKVKTFWIRLRFKLILRL